MKQTINARLRGPVRAVASAIGRARIEILVAWYIVSREWQSRDERLWRTR